MKTQYEIEVASSYFLGGRDLQEDSCAIFRMAAGARYCAIVADGMGGHDAGDQASSLAVKACRAHAYSSAASGDPSTFLVGAVAKAHRAVCRFGEENKVDGRTTIVIALLENDQVYVVNVGDSRTYHVAQDGSKRITRDDSVPEMLLAMGEITEEEMATHPDQGRLTRSVGGPDLPVPKVRNFTVSSGDSILLCSDGFWETVPPAEHSALNKGGSLEEALTALCATAAERGGKDGDNVCACALRVPKGQL